MASMMLCGRPDNGGSMHLRHVSLLQRDYIALYRRKLSYLYFTERSSLRVLEDYNASNYRMTDE
jgi:hypothetical protein